MLYKSKQVEIENEHVRRAGCGEKKICVGLNHWQRSGHLKQMIICEEKKEHR